MTSNTKYRSNREQIKKNILKAATTEFSLYGYSGASTQAIAERAGLKKSQLHYYIESKETLYNQVLSEIFTVWESLFKYHENIDETPQRALSNYVKLKLEFALKNPELSKIFTMEIISGGKHIGHFWPKARQSTQQIVDIIDLWIKDKKIRTLNSHLLLMNIWALTQYYADYSLQVEQILDRDIQDSRTQTEILDELTHFVLHGCGLTPL